ncbi:hypothetical protein GCM10011571_16970 [Marinithermofilum abyssi]|uniref:Uncharacterized protein n=1 Tax=Marinithermofilum abyssi TaxID=1571185 RepID=A0A8J2YE02_9BACL|nr:hypothetical protein GCM10011571_16970 [Marinithermofilum abyssi]
MDNSNMKMAIINENKSKRDNPLVQGSSEAIACWSLEGLETSATTLAAVCTKYPC